MLDVDRNISGQSFLNVVSSPSAGDVAIAGAILYPPLLPI